MKTDESVHNDVTAASSIETCASIPTSEQTLIESSEESCSNVYDENPQKENVESDKTCKSTSGELECENTHAESSIQELTETADKTDFEFVVESNCPENKTQNESYTIYWESDVLGLILKPNVLGQAVIRRVTSEGKAKGLNEARVGDILCSINEQNVQSFSFQMITDTLKSLSLPIQLTFSAAYNQRSITGGNLTGMDNLWRRPPSSFAISDESTSAATELEDHNEYDNSSHISNTMGSFKTNLGEEYEYDVVWESGSLGCAFKQRAELPVVKSVSDTAETLSIRQIQPGDILIMVNGLRTELIGFKTTVYILKSAPKPVFLRFQRNPLLTTADTILSVKSGGGQDEAEQVEKAKQDEQTCSRSMQYVVLWNEGSLGIQVKAREDGFVYVHHITGPGDVSPVSDKIAVGDILVRVADKKIGQIGTAAAFSILRNVVKPVELEFERVENITTDLEEELSQTENDTLEATDTFDVNVSTMEEAENENMEAHTTNRESMNGSGCLEDKAPIESKTFDDLVEEILEGKQGSDVQLLDESIDGLEHELGSGGMSDSSSDIENHSESESKDFEESAIAQVEEIGPNEEAVAAEGQESLTCAGEKETTEGEEGTISHEEEKDADGDERLSVDKEKVDAECEEAANFDEIEEDADGEESLTCVKEAAEDDESVTCAEEKEFADGEQAFVRGEEKETADGEESARCGAERETGDGVESSTCAKEAGKDDESLTCVEEREFADGEQASICGEEKETAEGRESARCDEERETAEGQESVIVSQESEHVSESVRTKNCHQAEAQTEDVSTDLNISLYSQFRLRNIQNRDPPPFSEIESGHLKVTLILNAFSPPSYQELFPERVLESTSDTKMSVENLSMSRLLSPSKKDTSSTIAESAGNKKASVLPSAGSRLTKYRIRWEQGLLGITFKRTKGRIIVSRLTGHSDCEGIHQVHPGDWLYAINNLKTLPMRLSEAMVVLKTTSKPVKLQFIAS
ncbi:unnamed protein product [Albugo candida]|uniref:PDZ domain-containing protein n=1 Tax=Albugo candida TaxID=65357 RepID=A0A024G831_9STRA|nr:unnamed protein product [Albugo candida]|eukprot:CCI42725.1 unnamed protein product [Albugo candida]